MLCIVCTVYYVLYVLCYVMNWYVWVNIFTLLSSQRVLLGITCIACCTPCVAHIWISETQQIQHNTAWGSHSVPHSRQDQLIASACLCFGNTEYSQQHLICLGSILGHSCNYSPCPVAHIMYRLSELDK